MLIHSNDQISVFRSCLQETVSVVIKTEEMVMVVDPNWLPQEVEEIRAYVYKILGQRTLYLLFTHSDYDHILGYKAFPDAMVIASSAFANSNQEKKTHILTAIKSFDDEFYLSRNYELVFPPVNVSFENDRETVKLGGLTFTFYNAPGHNDDGMFTMIEPLGILLAGDYFCDVEIPYIDYSGELYETSVLKLDELMNTFDIQLLIPGHGSLTKDKQEMKKRQVDSLTYIRAMRRLIKEENQSAIDQLIEGYKFPTTMKKVHQDNQLLLKKEMEL